MKPNTYNNVGINAEGKIIAVGNMPYAIEVDSGQISYFEMVGTIIAIAAVSDGTDNFVKANVITTLADSSNFDNGGSDNGRLAYTGIKTGLFNVGCTLSVSPINSNDTFCFAIFKNGTIHADSKVLMSTRTTLDISSISLQTSVELTTDDYIEVYVANITGTDDITIYTLMILANG